MDRLSVPTAPSTHGLSVSTAAFHEVSSQISHRGSGFFTHGIGKCLVLTIRSLTDKSLNVHSVFLV